jgi:3-hydroxyacyl-[acyl-carrier-protein] dehydratase
MIIETDLRELRDGEADFTATTRNSSGVTCQAKMTLATRPKKTSCSMPLPFNEFDKNDKILMDIKQIRDIIPHRYPFLLVDYIVSVNGPHVVAVKNLTYNEPFIHSYHPEAPYLAGSVQAEIIAQAGCVSMLTRPENKGKLAYFLSIEQGVFMHPARPGDQLIIEVNMPEGHSRFGRGEGFLRVGDTKICEVSMKFAIVDQPTTSTEPSTSTEPTP